MVKDTQKSHPVAFICKITSRAFIRWCQTTKCLLFSSIFTQYIIEIFNLLEH